MSIRQRLAFSLSTILLLFAGNLGVYLWSAHLRSQTMQLHDRALKRQAILATLRQEIDNLHKQVILLSEIDFNDGRAANSPEAKQLFSVKLAEVAGDAAHLRSLEEANSGQLADQLLLRYTELSQAWTSFYEYLGAEQTWALANVARADPLSMEIQTKILPAMQEAERERAKLAEVELARVERVTNRWSAGMFAISALFAAWVAVRLWRYLGRGFAHLQLGAQAVGAGQLNYRIPIHTHDELGQFAQSFNEMASALDLAQTELKTANHDLAHANQEIERRQEQELALAAGIQQGLMAVRVPDLPFAAVQGRNVSCTQIGGDFFDVVVTSEGVAVIIADVSGKGISAAIMASMLQGLLRSDLAACVPLNEVVANANRFLTQRDVSGKYATVAVVLLRPDGEVEYVNCGHIYPVVAQNGRVWRLTETNVPVGLLPGTEYVSARLRLSPGDRIVLVTDGVTEAADAAEEFFGDRRLEAAAMSEQPFETICAEVHQFCGSTPLSDDCTIVELTYTGAASRTKHAESFAAAG